jgi:arylsulfatase
VIARSGGILREFQAQNARPDGPELDRPTTRLPIWDSGTGRAAVEWMPRPSTVEENAMSNDDDKTEVLIGGYLSADAAHDDYNAVLQCGGHIDGAVGVTKDLEGNLAVEQTDHMVRRGAEGLGAVGFAVGLFAPPLLAATAIGAAVGAVAGKGLHKKTGSKIEAMAGATIPIGGAGLIVAYPHADAVKIEAAVTRAIQKAVGEADGHHVKALKGALADAQSKMAQGGA